METILQVKQIEKIYGNKGSITRAIEDISFEVKKGEFVGIMGPVSYTHLDLRQGLYRGQRPAGGQINRNGAVSCQTAL